VGVVVGRLTDIGPVSLRDAAINQAGLDSNDQNYFITGSEHVDIRRCL
jgi:hypothetical protein